MASKKDNTLVLVGLGGLVLFMMMKKQQAAAQQQGGGLGSLFNEFGQIFGGSSYQAPLGQNEYAGGANSVIGNYYIPRSF